MDSGSDGAPREEPTTTMMTMPVTATQQPAAAERDAEREPPTTFISGPPTVSGASRTDATSGTTGAAPAAATGSVWPGLTAAGLPTRVPRQADEDSVRDAFADSWEAEPSGPTPLTRAPFTPTYLAEPPRPRRALSELTDPAGATPGRASTPTEPKPAVPPKPVEPPEPRRPPEPVHPPEPPEPEPGPTPFPSPTPVPKPPEPVPPTPIPPGPPVPTPPAPFPPPPGPVPPPPAISGVTAKPAAPPVVPGRGVLATPARTGTSYQGGNYGELQTEAITGVVVSGARDSSLEMSGTLAGHLLTRGAELSRKRERQRRLRTIGWVTFALLMFAIGIGVVVNILAGDFLSAVIETFVDFAG